jgi:hypothetical protein
MSLRAARARAAALKKIDEILSSARGRSHAQVAADIMWMFDPDDSMFLEIEDFPLDEISVEELFWPVVADWWAMCGFIPYDFSKLMRRLKPYWSPDYMSKEDRKVYDSLPDRFTVYRGQGQRQKIKCAWTLDVEKAKWFACRFNGITNSAVPVVLTATTTKANVALYLGGRNESEIVVFKPPRITLLIPDDVAHQNEMMSPVVTE